VLQQLPQMGQSLKALAASLCAAVVRVDLVGAR
jgi:hypothetical protein